jgi:hypothetical protein
VAVAVALVAKQHTLRVVARQADFPAVAVAVAVRLCIGLANRVMLATAALVVTAQ